MIGVGFDTFNGDVTRFLVDLQYTKNLLTSRNYTQIVRTDHNPANPNGHDLLSEGLHFDIRTKDGRELKFSPSNTAVPNDLGVLIKTIKDYFRDNAGFFVDIHTGNISPSGVPNFPP